MAWEGERLGLSARSFVWEAMLKIEVENNIEIGNQD